MHSEWQTPPQRWRQGGWVRLCSLCQSGVESLPEANQDDIYTAKASCPLVANKDGARVSRALRSVPDALASGPYPAASLDVIQNDTRRMNIRRPLVAIEDGARVGGLLRACHSRRESPSLGPAPCSQHSCHSR